MKELTLAGEKIPLGKILCIARNYVAHAKELGNEAPEAPVVFLKPSTAVIFNGETVVIPEWSSDCHYETELAVLIGRGGKNIPETEGLSYVAGYGVALDMTLRDVQGELKKKGLPWEQAKGFDTSCPLSDFVSAATVGDPQHLTVRLTVNDELRQDGETSLMIHPVAKIIAHMSRIFTLEEGDVILTGTPSGVGRTVSGDRLTAEVPGVAKLSVTIA